MSVAEAFRRALEDGCAATVQKMWRHVAPHLARPLTREQAEIVMHRARTEAESLGFPLRAYSHRWLTERGLPSGLPDHLRPRAERCEPVVVDAVGIAVKPSRPDFAPAAPLIRTAMSNKVMEMYADGVNDPLRVRPEMMAARERERRALFGRKVR